MNASEAKNLFSRLESANSKMIAHADAMGNSFMMAVVKAQQKYFDSFRDFMTSVPDMGKLEMTERLKWYAANSKELTSMLKDSGYMDIVGGYVGDYEKLAGLASDILGAGSFAASIVNLPPEYIEFLKARDMKYFDFLGKEAVGKLDKLLLEQIIVGRSPKDMLAAFKGAITGSYDWGTRKGLYEWHAGTYARTAAHRNAQSFMNYQVEDWNAKNPESLVDDFLYLGPVDSKMRPFCQSIIGQVFNEDEINEMDNDQSGDVLTDRGGWNCRHDWIPVPPDFADLIGETNILQDIEGIDPGQTYFGSADNAPHPITKPDISGPKPKAITPKQMKIGNYKQDQFSYLRNNFNDNIKPMGDSKIKWSNKNLNRHFGDTFTKLSQTEWDEFIKAWNNTPDEITKWSACNRPKQVYKIAKSSTQSFARAPSAMIEDFKDYNIFIKEGRWIEGGVRFQRTVTHEGMHCFINGNVMKSMPGAGNSLQKGAEAIQLMLREAGVRNLAHCNTGPWNAMEEFLSIVGQDYKSGMTVTQHAKALSWTQCEKTIGSWNATYNMAHWTEIEKEMACEIWQKVMGII